MQKSALRAFQAMLAQGLQGRGVPGLFKKQYTKGKGIRYSELEEAVRHYGTQGSAVSGRGDQVTH